MNCKRPPFWYFQTLLAVLILSTMGCASQSNETWTLLDPVRYQLGDNLDWANEDWDDQAWPLTPLLDLPDAPGQLWIRFDLPASDVKTLGIRSAGVVAREIFWDGRLIGQSGQVGTNKDTEVPGPIDATFRIPDSLATPGIHSVAVRISSFRRPAGTSGLLMNFVAGDFGVLTAMPIRNIGVPLLFLGGFILVALYYTGLYIADRQRIPYLLTALLCFAVAGLLIAESWRNAIGYTFDYHAVRLSIIELLTTAVGLLLSATFVVQFNVSRKWKILGTLGIIITIALLLIQDHETSMYVVFAISLVSALGLAGLAIKNKYTNAWLAAAGVLICLVALVMSGYEFMDGAFFPAFGVLVACLLTSVGLQTREERQRLSAAKATAARLEAELLKKHLQPHFLMNTLTSFMEWVETDPAQGTKAIEALAGELRTLTSVSDKQNISMAQELDLCRAHLKVMGFRQAVQFEFVTKNIDDTALIPPAVIHTLLENAITHNAYKPGTVTFTLTETRENNVRRLKLETPMAGEHRSDFKEGGGLKYVKARLEEAAPSSWRLESQRVQNSWVTIIELPVEV